MPPPFFVMAKLKKTRSDQLLETKRKRGKGFHYNMVFNSISSNVNAFFAFVL